MNDSERFNVLQALELRHDELLQALTELDLRVEAVLAHLRPVPATVPAPQAAKPASGHGKKQAA